MLKNCLNFIESKMAFLILGIACFALCLPKACLWIELDWINWLLMLIMFGMGMTLKLGDFKAVFLRPRDILLGTFFQFLIMPLIALLLGLVFGLNDALFAGVVLVGACPGGTASNVITYLAKGDVALSVGMTSVNTLLSPILTPAITYIILNQFIEFDVFKMFISILEVVILPIFLGLFINAVFKKFAEKIIAILPAFSILAIGLIVASVVAHNNSQILDSGLLVLCVVILHNLLGFASGYCVGKIFKMESKKLKALSIEIGMQNSGLATSIAHTAFASLPMASVPGAIFSVWHNISGGILAHFLSKKK